MRDRALEMLREEFKAELTAERKLFSEISNEMKENNEQIILMELSDERLNHLTTNDKIRMIKAIKKVQQCIDDELFSNFRDWNKDLGQERADIPHQLMTILGSMLLKITDKLSKEELVDAIEP